MKRCTSCLSEKPFSDFFRRKASPDGYQPICKACDVIKRRERKDPAREAEYQRAYRQRNLERKRQSDKAYHEANRDRHIAASRAYHTQHKAEMNAASRAYAVAHAEEISALRKTKRAGPEGDAIRARRRRHYAENKARYVANARKRERHIARATPAWADLEKIAELYEMRERLSAESGTVYHVDHIIPLRGKWVWGLHVDYNLQIIPANENLSKSNRLQDAA